VVDTFWRGVAPEPGEGAAGKARAPRAKGEGKRGG
jgi:hypothetical protein